MNYLIIGGVAGGATAAARIRRNDEHARIVLVERGAHISFANCGLPYHLSGVIAGREQLLVTNAADFSARYDIAVRQRTEAVSIDRARRTVRLRDLDTGHEEDAPYDRLLLAPGAAPIRPALPGMDSPRVFTLRNLPDLDRIMAHLGQASVQRAVVVGGGFIGIEVAENLRERGLSVALVEGASQVMAPLDPEMAALVHDRLEAEGIALHLSARLAGIAHGAEDDAVRLEDGRTLPADIIVLALGVRPETALAREAGLALGDRGGIRVDGHLRTSDPDIFAVGDAIELVHRVSGRSVLLPLAGPANRQARIAADNMVRGPVTVYPGVSGTAILKVFGQAVGMTGLNARQLVEAGLPFESVIIHGQSHAGYYPGAEPMALKVLFAPDGRLLGAQAVGGEGVDKRIDVIATAMQCGQGVQALAGLELSYAPPFGSARDPVNTAGLVASNVLDGTQAVLDWQAVSALPAGTQLVDVRTPLETGAGTIPGALTIPLDDLRQRLGELDPQRPVVVYCQIGQRGYLAARILAQHGFAGVRNLTGGYKTWSRATAGRGVPAPLPVAPAVPVTVGRELDATGLQCPGPIMQTYQAISEMREGEVLRVVSTDPAFGCDLQVWADKTGHALLSLERGRGQITALVRKGGAQPVTAPAGDKATLVVFSGDLDKVMASLIIANGALAMGRPVSLFFTFWGLNVLRRADPPALDKPLMDRLFGWMMPRGAARLDSITRMNFGGMGARLIRKVMRDKQVALPAELLEALVRGGARLIACQMSMDVMGIRAEELIDGVELGGVATFLGESGESSTSLFI